MKHENGIITREEGDPVISGAVPWGPNMMNGESRTAHKCLVAAADYAALQSRLRALVEAARPWADEADSMWALPGEQQIATRHTVEQHRALARAVEEATR